MILILFILVGLATLLSFVGIVLNNINYHRGENVSYEEPIVALLFAILCVLVAIFLKLA